MCNNNEILNDRTQNRADGDKAKSNSDKNYYVIGLYKAESYFYVYRLTSVERITKSKRNRIDYNGESYSIVNWRGVREEWQMDRDTANMIQKLANRKWKHRNWYAYCMSN